MSEHPIPNDFMACLNKNNIIDADKEGSGECEPLRKKMYENCPESWASYFIQLRTMKRRQEMQKEQIAERMRKKHEGQK
ncbi:hypothetical protein H4218_001358 [Coemansia sp. IMI 209128]|nr:hypothetical protein H4218_001358 [Coemansia sp. IMI 209128]